MLKNVLSLLLSKFYSKKENEAVGHQAMPSGNKIDIAAHPAEIDGWTNFATYTTPTDGYVSIRAEAYKSTAAIQISTGSEDKMPSIFTAANNAGEWLQTVIPVSKGVSVRLQGGGIKNVVGYFSKTIGGGYQTLKKALLAGGVLCRLKHLCNSLQRNSLLARRNGWLNSLVQNSRPLILAHRPQEIGWNLSHRKQDTFALRPTLSKFLFKYLGFGRAVSPVKKATRVSIFTWKKGKPSRISYLLMLRAPSLLSTERRASAHNLTVGGASC